jgi:hypothetical protein
MTFTADLSGWCRKTAPEYADGVVRKVLMEIDSKLVLRSPVGDPSNWSPQSLPAPPGYVGGRFKGNWQYSRNTPETGQIDRIDPSGAIGSAERVGAIMSGPTSTVHFFANNLPYAQRIEDGWSWNQAPLGIINRIELELPSIFEQAKR